MRNMCQPLPHRLPIAARRDRQSSAQAGDAMDRVGPLHFPRLPGKVDLNDKMIRGHGTAGEVPWNWNVEVAAS